MAQKVLLLSPPFVKDYMRNARCDFVSLSGSQWFPLLLGYLGAFLEGKGCHVKLVDAPSYNLNFQEVEEIVDAYAPDFLVVYVGDKSRDSDIAFTDRLLGKRKLSTVFVGPYFAIDPGYFLEKSSYVRCGVVGEFENPVWELISGTDSAGVGNLVYNNNGQIVTNESRPLLDRPALDAIPFVSDFFNRHLDFSYYRTPSEPHPFVDIMTGRGCSWGLCSFCLWVNTYIKGKVYNRRSIENVIEEIAFIEKNMPQVRSVMIQDDTFSAEQVVAFCEAKLKRGLNIPWSCYARGELELATLQLMKKANCLNLHVGFESANNEVLKSIKKGLTKERMTQFAHDAKKAGLRIHGDFLIGLPGETPESLEELIDWACTIRPWTAQFQVFIPFPGTPLHQQMCDRGQVVDGAARYENLSSQDLEQISKRAYRRFYFSWFYCARMARHPIALVLKKFGIIRKSFASVFWRKMDIR